MRQTTRNLIICCAFTFLAACGGGGGGGSSVTDPAVSFPLRQAISDFVSNGKSEYYSFEGSFKNTDGSPYSVNGELQYSKTAASSITFEGRNAVRYTYSFAGDITFKDLLVNGVKNTIVQAYPTKTFNSYWDAITYSELGSLSSSSYRVNSTVTATPAFVKVGQQGTLFTAVDYLNFTKSTQQGTSTATFEVLPDTASSVLIKITEVNADANGANLLTEINSFRVNLSGTLERVSAAITYQNGDKATLTRINK